jgi:hypothetical protein
MRTRAIGSGLSLSEDISLMSSMEACAIKALSPDGIRNSDFSQPLSFPEEQMGLAPDPIKREDLAALRRNDSSPVGTKQAIARHVSAG